MINTEKAKVKISGLTPLFHNRLNPGVVEKSFQKTKVRGKGDKASKVDPKKEALKVLFKNKKGVYHPAEHIQGCMNSAAADLQFKDRKTWKTLFRAGVFVTPLEIPLKAKWMVDTRPEWVGRPRPVPMNRHRPRFDKWNLEFEVEIVDDRISLDLVKQMLMAGGMRYGIGDRRKRGMGKFIVKSFTPIYEKTKTKTRK